MLTFEPARVWIVTSSDQYNNTSILLVTFREEKAVEFVELLTEADTYDSYNYAVECRTVMG